MRVYFGPHNCRLEGIDRIHAWSNGIPAGLRAARSFLREVIEMAISTATELLDPITPQYIADDLLVGSWRPHNRKPDAPPDGIWALHALGFKNGTDGGLAVAINAIRPPDTDFSRRG